LDANEEDLEKLAVRMRLRRRQKMMEQQEQMRKAWGLPPPPENASNPQNPSADIQNRMAEMMGEMDDDVPTIKFGDASVAAPFTSKVSSVMSVVNIVRQGRSTLVAMIQMYKILALNSLITAYSLSVLHLTGVKQGDWQATIAGLLITVCFFGISRSTALKTLSKQRPQTNIFNPYIIISVLGQSLVHVAAMFYIRREALIQSEDLQEEITPDSEFQPNLINSAMYLVSLIMQLSTVAINYQGLPFRESLFQNKALFNSLLIVGGVAFAAASEISEELNESLQLVPFGNVSFFLELKR